MKFKPALFFVHRWLGIAMCLLFALWFASGIVMMYVEYPELTEEERLNNLTALDSSQILLTPEEAFLALKTNASTTNLSLSNVLGRPAYYFDLSYGDARIIFADNGEPLADIDENQAIEAVIHSGFYAAGYKPVYDAQIDVDQWTLTSSLNQSRPLHRVELGDTAGTVLYVSDRTGKIVRDTNRREILWNWVGSTIHWIYPRILRQNASLWGQVIIYVSMVGLASIVTGAIIGFIRIRIRNPYRGKDFSPYSGMLKLHHILGLVTLVFVSTFTFSGLMSMGPWGIFSSATSFTEQSHRYSGGTSLDLASLPLATDILDSHGAKELVWHQIAGESYVVSARSASDKSAHFDASGLGAQSLGLGNRITETIPDLLPANELQSLDTIAAYDNYYYSRHNRYRPLPVLRAKFDDPESTWFHIDLNTGHIVNRLTDKSRLERWIYNGLHSLDFRILLDHRPLWDLVLIVLSIFGLAFSITSIVVAWRRLTQ